MLTDQDLENYYISREFQCMGLRHAKQAVQHKRYEEDDVSEKLEDDRSEKPTLDQIIENYSRSR